MSYGSLGVTFLTAPKGTPIGNPAYVAPWIEQMGAQAGSAEGVYNGGFNGNVNPTSGFMYNPEPGSPPALVDTVSPLANPAQIGNYFLRNRSYSSDTMLVSLDAAIDFAQFEMWDIDGDPTNGKTEQWRITAYNGNWTTVVLTTDTIAPTNNLDASSRDGQAYVVTLGSLGAPGALFDRFVIEFIGTKGLTQYGVETIGMVLDNFEFGKDGVLIPEPSTYAALLGALSMGFVLRRRRRAIA